MPNKEGKEKKVKLKRAKLNKKEFNEIDEMMPKKKGRAKKVFKILFFVFLALFVVGVGVVLGVLSSIIKDTEQIDLAELKNLKLTSTVLDVDGKQIGQMSSGENRLMIEYAELPKHLIDAVVAIEDERFWTHEGVDIRRTGAAIVEYVLNRGNSSFGGSTITQQLIKNVTDDRETSWKRKIREWYRAYSLEQELDKDEILEAYLNKIYFGAGANGVEVAAQTYFAKSAKDVNLAESACLAAAIQTPEGTNPYNGEKSKERLIARQKIVLNKMLEIGKITEQEYNDALSYELEFKKGQIASASAVQPYFVDAVFKEVAKDLAASKNITYAAAYDMVASNGYVIYSTMDSDVQASIDKQAKNTKYFYKDKDGDMMQCAAIVIDNKTGNVVGMLGGVGEKKGIDFNRAMDAKLQPGSTFKPIAAYGPAFELGVSYPGMGIDDVPINLNGYKPKNWYGYYYGYVTARQAINQSMNIPAVKTLQAAGLDYAYTFAQRMGITTLTSTNKNYSMALGSANVKIIDMAAAYATMANGGIYTEPKLYTKVLDSEGKEILTTVNKKATRVMSATTAYMLTDCLRSVVNSGTGTSARFSTTIQIAGKTGNTNDDKDQWFAGYTPYYTMVVWNGYDDPETIGSRKNLGTYPYTSTVVFTNVMKSIHSGLKKASFTKPSGIVNATICTVSGLVATDACKADTREVVKSEIFASGKIPTDKCTVHKLVEVCSVSGKLPTDYCHMYEDLKEISVITREKNTKTSDSKYVMPDDICELHITEPEPEVPEEPVVPETPESSDTPVVPETPEVPETPSEPSTPEVPDTPTTPENSEGSQNSGVGGSIYDVQ